MPYLLVLLLAAAGAGVGWAARRRLADRLSGKTVLIVGNQSTGKSTLSNFLVDGEITAKYVPTQVKRLFKNPLKLESLGLETHVIDEPGGRDAMSAWEVDARAADIVCFVASWRDLASDERPTEFLAHPVSKWAAKREAQVVLVVSFLDSAEGASEGIVLDSKPVRVVRNILKANHAVAADLRGTDGLARVTNVILEALK